MNAELRERFRLLLEQERAALRRLDADAVVRAAEEKQAIVAALLAEDDVRNSKPLLEEIRDELRKSSVLLAHARDCLRDALGVSSAARGPGQRYSLRG
jgi:hypothetical protein